MVLAQDLRDTVLQAALQGKLTQQLETDSSVVELLNSIKEKQIKLIKQKKIRKRKNLAPIKDVPFDIPDNWKWKRMQDILNIRSAVRVHQADWKKSGIPFFRAREIVSLDKDGYVDNELFIDEELYEKFKEESGVPKKDDLMISGVGTLGNVYIVRENDKFYYKDASVLCFENIGNISSEYIKYALKSPIMLQQIYKDAMGTTVATLTIDRANAMIIPIPPIEEQQRIVDRVNELMEKIDEYEKVEKELLALEQKFPDDMKNALLQAAMQGKLTEQLDSDSSVDEMLDAIKEEKKQLIKDKKIKKDKALPSIEEDEIPFDIPNNWRWIRWGNLSYSIQYGYNAPAKENGKIKMVRISDIQDNKVLWETVPYCEIEDGDIETYLLKENDILFARTGGTVGKSFLVKGVEEKAIYAGYLIRTRYNNKLVAQYLKYFMESQLYWVQLQNGKTKGCQPNCNGQTLSKMIIPLPPVEEQQRIVERLEQLLPLCETL